MAHRVPTPLLVLSSCLAAAGILAACGGSDSPAAPVASTTTNLSGSVVKGPVNGSAVCAYKATSTGKGDQIKCVTTGSTGSYAMDIDYTGDVLIEATGGTYTDEATNTTKTLGDALQVVVKSQGGATAGVITPLTTMAYSLSKGLSGGVSSANFNTAATTVATQFNLASGVNLATTTPVVTGTTINAYGQLLRAVSQYVANGNTLASFVTATSPGTFQVQFQTAYATINGTPITLTITNGNTSGTGSTTTGGTTTATVGGALGSCGITVAGTGTVITSGFTVPFTLPATKICVTGIPVSSCGTGNARLTSLASAGATPSGNYSLNYTYSYAPGDCTNAVATVAY